MNIYHYTYSITQIKISVDGEIIKLGFRLYCFRPEIVLIKALSNSYSRLYTDIRVSYQDSAQKHDGNRVLGIPCNPRQCNLMFKQPRILNSPINTPLTEP